MDNVINKLEELAKQKLAEFEKAPLKTALKLFLVIWIVNKAIKFLKSN